MVSFVFLSVGFENLENIQFRTTLPRSSLSRAWTMTPPGVMDFVGDGQIVSLSIFQSSSKATVSCFVIGIHILPTNPGRKQRMNTNLKVKQHGSWCP